jgi:hypothetical protein
MNPVSITQEGDVVVDTGVVIIRKEFSSDQVVPSVCGEEFCAANVERV